MRSAFDMVDLDRYAKIPSNEDEEPHEIHRENGVAWLLDKRGGVIAVMPESSYDALTDED